MRRKTIHFGLIGLGLMGREFASAVSRWCHLLDDGPIPVIKGICNKSNTKEWKWYIEHFRDIEITTHNYQELLKSDTIDAIYCAIPHNLHEKIYIDIIKSGKHLFGEKPFGIDIKANRNIIRILKENPHIIARCSSEFPYYPGAQKLIQWIRDKKYGRIIEAKAHFHHSSDMDLNKPINWKRMIEFNGEYGCMGDLGFHTHHIPFRLGWKPKTVFANLQNIAKERPDKKTGKPVPCETWDNAHLVCECINPVDGLDFTMIFETKRMSPGSTNNWSIEVTGTQGATKFSTKDPRSFYSLEVLSKEQGWTRTDIGARSVIPSITGDIFEFGFSDAFQQMVGAFMKEFTEQPENHSFRTGFPEETYFSHILMTGALKSHKSGKKISLEIT
jgi:predicted dehydrogenase